MPNILEKQLSDRLTECLMAVHEIAGVGVATPFSDAKVYLPSVFMKVTKEAEAVPNTGIFSCIAAIEFRYLPKKTTEERALAIWSAVDAVICGQPFDVLADMLSDIDNHFVCHAVSLTSVEPTVRDGERCQQMALAVTCATV